MSKHEMGGDAQDGQLRHSSTVAAAPRAAVSTQQADATPKAPATTDQLLELEQHLQQQRAMHIAATVRQLRTPGAMPTSFDAGFDLACEEILHRLEHEQWELSAENGWRPVGGHPAANEQAFRVAAGAAAVPPNPWTTAVRLVLEATPEQLPLALDALRDLYDGAAAVPVEPVAWLKFAPAVFGGKFVADFWGGPTRPAGEEGKDWRPVYASPQLPSDEQIETESKAQGWRGDEHAAFKAGARFAVKKGQP